MHYWVYTMTNSLVLRKRLIPEKARQAANAYMESDHALAGSDVAGLRAADDGSGPESGWVSAAHFAVQAEFVFAHRSPKADC